MTSYGKFFQVLAESGAEVTNLDTGECFGHFYDLSEYIPLRVVGGGYSHQPGLGIVDLHFIAHVEFIGTSFEGARIKRCSGLPVFRDCKFIHAHLLAAHLNGTYDGCDFTHAEFNGAVLRAAIFENCNFRGAWLTGSTTLGATFENCDFSGTAFDPQITKLARSEALDFMAGEAKASQKGRIAYRTVNQPHAGGPDYEVGKTYVAPVMSWSALDSCHPGLHALGTLAQARAHFGDEYFLKVYYPAGEWLAAGNKIRGRRFRVLAKIDRHLRTEGDHV